MLSLDHCPSSRQVRVNEDTIGGDSVDEINCDLIGGFSDYCGLDDCGSDDCGSDDCGSDDCGSDDCG